MSRPRVLIVDDYADGLLVQALAFETAGFDVVTATSGAEAVEQARRCRPSVVVMDIFMPDVDGYEATRQIKAEPILRDVPVVAYTALPERVPRDGLFDAVCGKPCPPDVLIGLVRHALGRAP